MKGKRSKAYVLDALMLLLLPLLMAYSLIGENFHEIAGVTMGILFWIHFFLHLGFYRGLGKGNYSPYRKLLTVTNLLLLINLVCQPLTGILMSKHLFTWLPVTGFAAYGRVIHLALGYWGYALMSFHAGLHLPVMLKKIRGGKPLSTPVKAVATLIGAYGIYAFIHQQFPSYMLLRSEFLFLDDTQPLGLFLLEFLAVMVLFAIIGYEAAERTKGQA